MRRRRIISAGAAAFALLIPSTMSTAQETAWVEAGALRLVVRADDYLQRARAALGADPRPLAARPLAANLHAVVVLDLPTSLRTADQRHLDELTLTLDQAFEVAATNTLAALPPLLQSAPPVQRGRIGHVSGSVYEVGRVAIHSEWAALAEKQGGALLIALPTTDSVLYLPEATPGAVAALRKIAGQLMEKAPNPLSSAVLRWTKDRWEAVE